MTSATPTKTAEYISRLKKEYPDAHCELNYGSPFQLLIATILSAQCTDIRVNKVTDVLFLKYPEAQDLASAQLTEVEQIIKSTNFYRNKAKNIIECSRLLIEQYQGKVPPDMDKLIELPGVGRKTANVVLGNAFNIPAGVVVDTHVRRLSQRLGWTKKIEPEKIDIDLQGIVPKEDWVLVPHLLIFHGRRICKARTPACNSCFLFDICPRKKVSVHS